MSIASARRGSDRCGAGSSQNSRNSESHSCIVALSAPFDSMRATWTAPGVAVDNSFKAITSGTLRMPERPTAPSLHAHPRGTHASYRAKSRPNVTQRLLRDAGGPPSPPSAFRGSSCHCSNSVLEHHQPLGEADTLASHAQCVCTHGRRSSGSQFLPFDLQEHSTSTLAGCLTPAGLAPRTPAPASTVSFNNMSGQSVEDDDAPSCRASVAHPGSPSERLCLVIASSQPSRRTSKSRC